MKRLTKEYAILKKSPLPNVLARPTPDNLFLWHFVMFGMNHPFTGGFYHGVVIVPEEYPFKPPNIQYKTPNGRFKTNYNVCMSFTTHHPESWNQNWNIGMMLTGLISFMFDKEFADGEMKTSDAEKLKLAKASVEFNQKDKEFLQLFYEDLDAISFPKPAVMPARLDEKSAEQLAAEQREVDRQRKEKQRVDD
ncbi:uncharacterized protein LOC127594508 [Hippocampus zosterae]|uniref:uncharacterized protein LOC127594508 n=1 Tax=Hippocampus zosterae TaxID=109293 RepID=UPI00223D9E1A|nr:uncharacterized protein LOC127594508 [Hippocampus zosterae]